MPSTTESDHILVGTKLRTVAAKMKAVAILDVPFTEGDPKEKGYASERVMICTPNVIVENRGAIDDQPKTKQAPLSPRVAGVMARVDKEKGYWQSVSNNEIYGILGLAEDVDYGFDDPECKANELNTLKTTTVVAGPFRVWGNSGVYNEQEKQRKFLCVIRTEDQIRSQLARGLQWAIDKGITKNLVEEIEVFVNNTLAKMRAEGSIVNGKCWADKELNTPEEIMEGRLHFTTDWTPVYVLQELHIKQVLTNSYLTEVFG